jgi:hypothetical protein
MTATENGIDLGKKDPQDKNVINISDNKSRNTLGNC